MIFRAPSWLRLARTQAYLDFRKNNVVLAVPGDNMVAKFMAAALILNQKVGALYYNRQCIYEKLSLCPI